MKTFYKQLILSLTILTIFSTTSYSNDEGLCAALDLTLTQLDCADNGAGVLPVFNLTFSISGGCFVEELYWQIDGNGYTTANLPDAGLTVYDGEGINLINTTADAFYEIYYILDDGTQSSVYTWNNGNCTGAVPGCMNEFATNYNANATVDDGSCIYDATICDCLGNEHTLGVLTWVGDGFADQGDYNWDDVPVDFDCATWGYDCGDIDGAPTDDPNNVCLGQLPPNNGCEVMDCTADNMVIQQSACQDDGNGLQPVFNMTFTIGGDCYVNELHWQIDGQGFVFANLPDAGYDIFNGDGISLGGTTPDATYEIYYILSNGTQSATYTWENGNCDGEILGCMNEFATNYNVNATADDGTCLYDETICDCLGNEHTIGVLTWVGDGFADQGNYTWDGVAVDFDCETWGYDCGDIDGAPTDDPYNVCLGLLPPENGCATTTCTAEDLDFVQLECEDNGDGLLPVINLTFTIGGDCFVDNIYWQFDGGGYLIANLPGAGLDVYDGDAINLINTTPNALLEMYYVLSDGTESAVYSWNNGNCTGDILGCMDNTACNYNAEATVDNGTCDYSCYGCIDDTACNYDEEATISDASCEYESCAGCMDDTACNYDMEATIDDESCDYSCYGCMDDNACNYDSEATMADESCEYETCAGCMDDTACNYDMEATIEDESCEYESCAGCMDETACNYDFEATLSDDSCDYSCYGCMDDEACNYDIEATLSDDSCDYSCYGCMDAEACNYDVDATIEDDSCEYESCAGCMDSEACNFDADATIEDDSCEYESCAGCMDSEACNFDADATIDDASCEFESCLGCLDSEACNFDPEASISDGSCEYQSCLGCIDSMACNFDPEALISDESCEYESCAGCIDSMACNFDADAMIDDGSCEYETCYGCMDDAAINFDSTATFDDGSCIYDCEYPTITYMSYCDDNNSEAYFVEMTISDLGNGSPYTVSNNQNSDEIVLSFNGTINLGPFDNGQTVLITTTSETLAGCFLTSPVLTDDCSSNSIEEFSENDFEIYPNPNSGEFVLKTNEISGMTLITCYDLTGREVYNALEMLQSNSETTIQLNESLTKGSYLLKLGNGKSVVVKKLIIR